MSELIEIGYIRKTHGYKGEIKAKVYEGINFNPSAIKAFFIAYKGEHIPYFIKSMKFTSDVEAIIHFEELESKETADDFRGAKLFLNQDQIEIVDVVDSANQYIGYMIKDIKYGEIGKVNDVYEFPHQDLLSVSYKSKEVLIPFQEDLINEVNENQKTLIFNLPEGILEI